MLTSNTRSEEKMDTYRKIMPLISGNDTLDKILHIANFAGPLDEFERLVTNLIKKEIEDYNAEKAKNPGAIEHYTLLDDIFTLRRVKDSREGSLIQCLVTGLDLTTRKKDEGMAERFAKIVKNLLPHRYHDILRQISAAAPLEDKETKNQRELANRDKLDKTFHLLFQIERNQEIEAEKNINTDLEGEEEETVRGSLCNKRKKDIHKIINGCDISLAILETEDTEIMEDLLSKANNNNTPVLVHIKNKDLFMIGGDPLQNTNWTWTPLNLSFQDVNLLKQLPFDQGTLKRSNKKFNALIPLLKNGHGSLETVKDFIKNTEHLSFNDKGHLINNLYYLNLIHLMYAAFDLLKRVEASGKTHGIAANLFCIEIIGDIQRRLPPRVRQALYSGLASHYADRQIDSDGARYFGKDYCPLGGTHLFPEYNGFFYDMYYAIITACAATFSQAEIFHTYYEQLLQQSLTLQLQGEPVFLLPEPTLEPDHFTVDLSSAVKEIFSGKNPPQPFKQPEKEPKPIDPPSLFKNPEKESLAKSTDEPPRSSTCSLM